jgi:hypothetical protein
LAYVIFTVETASELKGVTSFGQRATEELTEFIGVLWRTGELNFVVDISM